MRFVARAKDDPESEPLDSLRAGDAKRDTYLSID
jgi:hypothetical protein